MTETAFRSGFVAILGRPNVGKSSLMNRFVGEKVAIISNHPQTTRSKLLGVASGEGWQIVFVDTPSLHKPRTKLGEYMMKSASEAREGVDAVLCVVDGQHIGAGDMAILQDIARMKCPRFLAVNKIDIVPEEKLFPQLAQLHDCGFDEIVSTSARTGENVDVLLDLLIKAMPEGPKYFPDDMITDQPERVMCAEIIREKTLRHLRDEVPHGIGVEMMEIRKVSEGLTEIHADIYCEKASHKSIIIGKQGAMLRTIGSEARVDIERLLDTRVNLKLWVKVRENWRNRMSDLKALGYEE
ncbi:MAG: GTPase Era [Clostridia bacterium]|nr:GTPase Era [Clostridia bacterium]